MRFVAIVFTLLIFMGTAFAEGWEPILASHAHGPERIIAVDKSSQMLIMLEQKSPLHEVLRFPCTTGQSVGDKAVEGDLRTPEGVYFVGNRIGRKLDWDLYGDLAYSLNYPNPVDRINGKTGGGIWIHGRGKEFVPRDTRGCVALKASDMRDIAGEIAFGTPVVIASNLEWSTESDNSDMTVTTLAKELETWALNWQNRDEAFFEHYDSALMGLSEGRSFDGFIENKKNIFAAKPWIHVMVANVHVMPGPDYWVTWFDQYYRTPGKVSTTGKRFYWKKNTTGQWRIVGREYVPATKSLEPEYLAAKTDEVKQLVEKWRSAWIATDIDAYQSLYSRHAIQGTRRGAIRIANYKKTLWAKAPPARVEVDQMKVSFHPRGLKVASQDNGSDPGR